MRVREGDFVETVDGLIFDVKGLIHPPDRVIAYVRYVPDPAGDRVRSGRRYRKIYGLSDRLAFLRERAPGYVFEDPVFGMELQGVPWSSVLKVYKPKLKVRELLRMGFMDKVKAQALEFIKLLAVESGVSVDCMGLSGSILIGLHREQSDIDVIVYGRGNSRRVYEALARLMESSSKVRGYTRDELVELYLFRSRDTAIPFKPFLKVEMGKRSQGKYMGRDFFVRFVPDWSEVDEKYGDRVYRALGYCTLRAVVVDNSDSIFTPCRYPVKQVEIVSGVRADPCLIKEICSFRGRFCEQASAGDVVRASGKLEMVRDLKGRKWLRLLIGCRKKDYLIPERFLS